MYRPLSVTEPFCLGHATHHPLADVARDFDAELVRGALAEVDPAAARVTTSEGATLSYDSLLVAVGARSRTVSDHAITFGAEGAPEALSGLLADLEEGYARASRSSSRAAPRGACRSTSWRSSRPATSRAPASTTSSSRS